MKILITILIFSFSFIIWKLFIGSPENSISGPLSKITVEEVFPDCHSWKKHKTQIVYKNPDKNSKYNRIAWFDAFIPGDDRIVVLLNPDDGMHRREMVKLEDIKQVWN